MLAVVAIIRTPHSACSGVSQVPRSGAPSGQPSADPSLVRSDGTHDCAPSMLLARALFGDGRTVTLGLAADGRRVNGLVLPGRCQAARPR